MEVNSEQEDDDDDDEEGTMTGVEATQRVATIAKATDFSGLSYTIAGASIAGPGNDGMALKIRTSRSTIISVKDNYTITRLSVVGSNNYTNADVVIDGVYVDGGSENLLD